MNDRPELWVDGKIYHGWTELRVSRGLDRCAADFEVAVSERWPGLAADWPILPFTPVEVRLGADLVLTGYVDRLAPDLSADGRRVRVAGRSKTADLIDCSPELPGTEFRRATLPAIARALAKPFGIEVLEAAPTGGAFALEAVEKGDTAWETIERLCRMRAVLGTDDPQGRLVLTRAGERRASGELVQGQNVLSASAKLDGSKRYSRYVVITQQPSAAAWDLAGDGDEADEEPAELPGGESAPAIMAVAEDPDVPRYRPRVIRAEGNGGAAEARARAVWAAATGRGKALQASVVVAGWRQPDGRLWQVNEMVATRIPYLQLDRELLAMEVTWSLSLTEGRRTELVLVPPEALTPEPVEKKAKKGAGAGAASWADVNPIR